MSFEDLNIEDITFCPDRDNGSGLKCRLYYAPEDFFFHIPMPIPDKSYASEIIVPDEILVKSGRSVRYIDILINENELKSAINGSIGKQKLKTSLQFFIPGFTASVIGFIQRTINIPFVFFIQDSIGQNWQIGHSRNRAFIENADLTSGKVYEDNSGAAVSVNCNSPILYYPFSLDHIAIPGDFNNDFNNDFFVFI